MKILLAIFSGYNQRAVIAFLRALKHNQVEEYAIIASSHNDPIFLTDYKEKVFYVREKTELDKEEIFQNLCMLRNQKGADHIVVVPSTEALNRFFLFYREDFAVHNIYIPLVNEQLYKTISDKDSFWKICKDAFLEVPKTFEFPREFVKEFVAKPKSYVGRDGISHSPELIYTQKDYIRFRENNFIEDFTFQEYVRGESYYLLYYVARKGNIFKFSQVNYLQQANGKSILMAAPARIHHEPIADRYEKFLRKLGFWGFVMIELRKMNDKYIMIEANPRLWGPSQLIVDLGIPLFEAFLFDLTILDAIPIKTVDQNAKYCWSTGTKKPFERENQCFWHEGGMPEIIGNEEKYLKYDIYNRKDTHGIYDLERKKVSEHGY